MYSDPAWGTGTRVWHWLTDWLYQMFNFICGASYLDPTYTFQPWMDPKALFSLRILQSALQTPNHNITDNSLLNWCPFFSFNCSYLPWRFCSVSIFLDCKFILGLPPFPHLTSDTMQMFSSEIFLRESHKVWAKTGNIFTKNSIWSIRSAGSTASSRSIGCNHTAWICLTHKLYRIYKIYRIYRISYHRSHVPSQALIECPSVVQCSLV